VPSPEGSATRSACSKEVDIGSNGVILNFKDLMRKGGIMAEERSLAELKDRVKKLGGYL